MRISRKIGIGFFITFLLVILLGGLSIYSLRHIYRGLNQVFVTDLPASRATFQIAISMENMLTEFNNYFITGNENFKIKFGKAHKTLQDDLSGLKKFILKDDEKDLFEEMAALVKEMHSTAGVIFDGKSKMDKSLADINSAGAQCQKKLAALLDFEQEKMQGEKDFLLVQAQHLSSSNLIMEASAGFSNLLNKIAVHSAGNRAGIGPSLASDLMAIEKLIRDYKNYYSYALSDAERGLAAELGDLTSGLKSAIDSMIALKAKIDTDTDSLLSMEAGFMEALDRLTALKKNEVSSKLGVAATLTEDIPAIYNISKLKKDIAESWQASARYILTGDEKYKDLYNQLRQGIDRDIKDYGRHARLRNREGFFNDIMESDRAALEAIGSNINVSEKKGEDLARLNVLMEEIRKKIDELLAYSDSLIKGGADKDTVMEKYIPARWALLELKNDFASSCRLVSDYLNQNQAQYKDDYSQAYFDMKKYINRFRGFASSDKEKGLIKDTEAGLDDFNKAILDIIAGQDAMIKETGWTIVKLQDAVGENLDRAMETELSQIQANREDIKKRIAVVNTIIFIIIGVVAVIAVFVIFYTTRSITNPIQKLYEGAGVIGMGNLDHRLDIKTGDEIEDLAEGFNTMAGELKELYTNLENKVKERTAQLAEANKTLASRKDELEKTNEQLKELDRMKSDFVGNVVHELRTPLTLIKGNIDNIDKGFAGEVKPKQKEILGDVFRITNRLARLVNDLLDLSKIESGKMELAREDLDMVEMAGEIIKDFESLADKKKIGLKKEFLKSKIIINADRDKLTQVFVNLIGNALKFTDKGGVTVKITELQDEAQVEIEDTGPGMTKEECEKIFDKFVRVVAEKKEGTGLGLPIAKDIITLHKGRIRVESAPGKGSTFIFNLPK